MNVALSAVSLPLIFVFIISFALISYFKKKPHPEYQVKTGPARRHSLLFSIFFWLGLVLLWVAFFLQFSSEFPIDFCWIFILLGGLISLLSLGALSLITFQYEAIKGDEVVIRKFKNKIIPISSIAQISPINVGIYFLDKDGKKLFSIASMSANIDLFVSTLVEKNEILSKHFSCRRHQIDFSADLCDYGRPYSCERLGAFALRNHVGGRQPSSSLYIYRSDFDNLAAVQTTPIVNETFRAVAKESPSVSMDHFESGLVFPKINIARLITEPGACLFQPAIELSC